MKLCEEIFCTYFDKLYIEKSDCYESLVVWSDVVLFLLTNIELYPLALNLFGNILLG